MRDGDVHSRREMAGDVEQGIEGCETDGAHDRDLPPRRCDGRRGSLQVMPREHDEYPERECPAARGDTHGGYLPDGETASHRIAGPHQRRERKQDIGLAVEPLPGGSDQLVLQPEIAGMRTGRCGVHRG